MFIGEYMVLIGLIGIVAGMSSYAVSKLAIRLYDAYTENFKTGRQ